MRSITFIFTSKAKMVSNKTIGTTYFKIEGMADGKNCFLIYPSVSAVE